MSYIFKEHLGCLSKALCAVCMLFAVSIGVCVAVSLADSRYGCAQAEAVPAQGAKIALDVKGMNIIDVLKILADQGNLNLSIGGNVQGRITLFLKNIDVWDAFEIVIMSGDLAYERVGDVIYIITEREYEQKYGRKYADSREMKVFVLKYAKAAKVGAVFSQIASKIGKVIVDDATNTLVVMDIPSKIGEMEKVTLTADRPLITEVFALNYLPVASVQEKIAQSLTPEVGSLKVDELTNKLVVTDYAEKIGEVQRIVRAFDEKPLQVLIDAKIIELRPSKNFYSGIDWHYWIQKYFEVQGVFEIPTTSTDKITVGTVTNDEVTRKGDYKGVMEFLETFGQTKVLSTPRILALNNQEAKILVGSREAYITETVSQAGDSSVTAQTVNFVDVGVKLYVTPTINRAGYVTLKIRPEISSAETETIVHQNRRTEIPIVSTSEAETTIIVRDGVNIILGGLRKVTHDKEKKQVPFLGSIPVIGALFSNKKEEWSKNELVILLVPYIVSGEKAIEFELREKQEVRLQEAAALELAVLNDKLKKKEQHSDDAPQSSGVSSIAVEAAIDQAKNIARDTEAVYEKEACVQARQIGGASVWEKEAMQEYMKSKAQEAKAQKEFFGELEQMEARITQEQEAIDSFLDTEENAPRP